MRARERWERWTISRRMLRLEEVEGGADGKQTGGERVCPSTSYRGIEARVRIDSRSLLAAVGLRVALGFSLFCETVVICLLARGISHRCTSALRWRKSRRPFGRHASTPTSLFQYPQSSPASCTRAAVPMKGFSPAPPFSRACASATAPAPRPLLGSPSMRRPCGAPTPCSHPPLSNAWYEPLGSRSRTSASAAKRCFAASPPQRGTPLGDLRLLPARPARPRAASGRSRDVPRIPARRPGVAPVQEETRRALLTAGPSSRTALRRRSSLGSPIFVLSSLEAHSRVFIECSYRRPVLPNRSNRNRAPLRLSPVHRHRGQADAISYYFVGTQRRPLLPRLASFTPSGASVAFCPSCCACGRRVAAKPVASTSNGA
ncbi:hypothetical protein DFH08DRAFT_246492 [Mycena albidolilacea]|uniref:Uncharacterized protein n=1 Tax=Mycena albidolilacea TaxID=1033008 RepID=A0AAD6ZU42_9AGAR|nr:hypothetical protein DFH08DRAFT_246492 [Mycena albidolilacea]